MSKNYFRSQLRRLGKGKEKRNKSTASISLESSTPSASPVHVSIPKHDSSYSLSSNTSGTSCGPTVPHSEELLERKEVISITGYVQKFVAAISELKKAIEAEEVDDISHQELEEVENGKHSEADIRVHLRDLIYVVHSCLDQYQGMRSTETKNAATQLMSSLSTCDHETASQCLSCNSAVDVLVDAFTTSVQVFFGGEGHEPLLPQHRKFSTQAKGFSKSQDYLTSRYSSCMDLTQPVNEPIVDKIDEALAHTENNIGVAARYIKMKTKYHREVTAYLSKRGQIEMRYHQEMLKLARKTHSAVSELQKQEECLPLVDLFLESVDQDMRFASNCNTTYNIQVGGRVIEPLEQQTAENERVKKELMHTWQKELKKLSDATAAMKSAKTKYQLTGQDLSRVKTLLSAEPYGKQADKRKREVVDLEMKWKEAEATYKNAIAVCNACQYQVHKSSQQSILCAYRRLVLEFDRTLKSKLETYFQLQHNFFFPIPDVMDSYLSTLHDFEIGEDFMQYIKRHPTMMNEPEDFLFQEFNPEEEIEGQPLNQPSEIPRMRSSTSSETVQHVPPLSSDHLQQPQSPQPYPSLVDGSESGMRISPYAGKLEMARPNSTAFLLEMSESMTKEVSARSSEQPWLLDDVSIHPLEEEFLSKNSLTHSFIRLQTPSRCRECDNFVYFNGYECETCGLACHKKCLVPLSILCGNKRLDRKLTTFGVEFLKHLEMSKTNIPIIVTKCIKEIEERGLDTHGLYRISATKTKLEHLCQLFESGVDRVDLSDRQPHLVASCLKLYFRQLPEPIFTFSLYEEMVSFAREASHVLPCNLSTVRGGRKEAAVVQLENLREMLSCLDHQRYLTLARLFYHLKRVSSLPHVQKNSMPASNLGIVFGPTLLRRRDNVTSLVLLADMTAQAKAIEILISHVNEVFTVSEDEILHVEGFYVDEENVTEERLVDGLAVAMEQPAKLDESDFDDSITKTPYRTPFGTPPQRRRENICELGEVLEALQYSCQQRLTFLEYRNSSPTNLEGQYSLPGRVEESISTSGDQLAQNVQILPDLSRPVISGQESSKRAHKVSENDGSINSDQSKHSTTSPSNVGIMSNFDTEIVNDFDTETWFAMETPPPCILNSSTSGGNTTEGHLHLSVREDYQSTERCKETNISQEANEYYYQDNPRWIDREALHNQSSPTSLNCEQTTEINTEKQHSDERRVAILQQNTLVGACDVFSTPSSHDSVHIPPLSSQEDQSWTRLTRVATKGSRHLSFSGPLSSSKYSEGAHADYSATSKSGNNVEDVSLIEQPSHSCSPVSVEEETDEVVTTFNYDSDDSDHTSYITHYSNEPTSLNSPKNEEVHVKQISPWHDKSRKIRINPLRVLKMKQMSVNAQVLLDPTSADRVRMISPDDVAIEVTDKLKRSRSCGLIDRTRDASSISPEPLHMITETIDQDPSSPSVSHANVSQPNEK